MTARRLLARASLVALLVLTLAPETGVGTASAAPVALFPDMKTLPPRALKLDRADVSVDGSGQIHNLLRFSNTAYNAGQGPLILNADINAVTRSGPATQRVMNGDGSFSEYDAGTFYWHEAHQHYHFDDWGTYQLWTKADYDAWVSAGRPVNGRTKKIGTKTTSCVLDEEFIASLPGTTFPAQYYGGCLPVASGQLRQILSVGWGDTYDYWRAEQWIDLDQETLADGQYVLRSVGDPKNKIYESPNKADASREGQTDNEGVTPFTIAGGVILDGSPPTGTVTINHVDASTQTSAVSVDVIGRDDVSGVDQFRLSSNGTTWATFPYTSGDGSIPTVVAWDLADARYGGSATGGDRLVYAQTHDRSGKWSSTFTDSINLLVNAPPPSSGYGGAVAADGPVAYWRLAESSGASATDSVGPNVGTYRNGVALGAASLISDTTNTAAAFDGVDDVGAVASSTGLSPTGAVSVEAWLRPSAKPAAGSFASVVTKAESYSLQFNGPQLEFTTVKGATRRRVQAPAAAVVAGQTYHVVGTYDGATQRLYVNGVQVASGAFSGAVNANTSPVLLGSWDTTSEFLSGTLDEVAVYAKVLTPAQVTGHYGQGIGTDPPPPPAPRTLTVVRAGTGSGTVTSGFPVGINCGTTCTTTVTDGVAVTLTAAAASGSTFAGWSGGGCAGTNPCAMTISADATVTATFTTTTPPPPTQRTLTVVPAGTGSGTVTSSPVGINCGTTCSTAVPDGTAVTLTASAASGSTFTGWAGGGCAVTSPCTTTVTADTSVTATFTSTTPPPPGSGYGSVVAADGPVSFWRLGEASGTAAADSVGTSTGTYRNGVVLGAASLTSETTNKAATFDGVNDAVSVPSSTGLSPTAAITVEAWVRPSAKPAAGSFASVVTKAESYSLQFNGPQLEFTTIRNGTRRRVQAPAAAVVAGGTYHVVGTFDGTTQRLYVNGVQVASGTFSGAVSANTSGVLIGSWDATSEFLAGTIDDVAVFGKVLTPAQVANHYAQGKAS